MASFCRPTTCAECAGEILSSHLYCTEFSGVRGDRSIDHVHEACQQFRQMLMRAFFDGIPLPRGSALKCWQLRVAGTEGKFSLAPPEAYAKAQASADYIRTHLAPKCPRVIKQH